MPSIASVVRSIEKWLKFVATVVQSGTMGATTRGAMCCVLLESAVVPLVAGKWQTRISSWVWSARRCSSVFHSRVRLPFEPPQSAVIVSVVARGKRSRPRCSQRGSSARGVTASRKREEARDHPSALTLVLAHRARGGLAGRREGLGAAETVSRTTELPSWGRGTRGSSTREQDAAGG